MQLDYSTEGMLLVLVLFLSSHIGHRYFIHMYLRFVWVLNQRTLDQEFNLLVVCNLLLESFVEQLCSCLRFIFIIKWCCL